MTYFLAKTEPNSYSVDQLERDQTTVWDGVTNPQAVRDLREMRPGDVMFIYHSGGQSAIVGWARVVSEARDDPRQPKSATVEIAYGGRIEPPVTLTEIKQSNLFGDWALVRQGRLSTMRVPEEVVTWLRKLRTGVP